jgi:hypothetical protein
MASLSLQAISVPPYWTVAVTRRPFCVGTHGFVGFSDRTSASQAAYEGSIPFTRSSRPDRVDYPTLMTRFEASHCSSPWKIISIASVPTTSAEIRPAIDT